MPESLLNIVHEDDRLLVLNKPAGLVVHPTKGDETTSLVGRVRLYLQADYHLINRLDRETTGLVLFAKQDTAARAIRRAWETRNVQKTYLAIVHGHPKEAAGKISAALGRDLDSHVAIKDRVVENGFASETSWKLLRTFTHDNAPFSLLEVQPHSGRKHQIRIHLSHIGHPIVGDKIYGPDENLYIDFIADRLTEAQRAQLILPFHALHAQWLQISLPQETLCFEALPEPYFTGFLRPSESPTL